MRAPDFWRAQSGRRAGAAAALLMPLGAAWGAAGRLRRGIAHPYRAPVPVICVGNLVAGGAGKTPVALALAGALGRAGVAVHIVSRGYGGRCRGPLRVDPAGHDAASVGDEALLLGAAAPCWVARDRAAGVRAAVAAGAAAIVLDDGFQNPGVAKDLSLLVVDAEYGFGNRRVMPAGPLREPVAAGLARAAAVVLVGDGPAPGRPGDWGRPALQARLEPLDSARWAGVPAVAFAGIGHPDKFFATLRAAGARLVAARAFPDHHPFTDREIAALRLEAERAGATPVTTAKDWVRLAPRQRAGIAVLEVALRWRDESEVARLLAGILGRAAPERSDGCARRAAGG